jgi:hypothetical protein
MPQVIPSTSEQVTLEIPKPVAKKVMLPEADAVDLATQAAEATQYLGGDYETALKVYGREILEGDDSNARNVIGQTDLVRRSELINEQIENNLSDPESDAIDNLFLIQQTQQLSQDPVALERNAVEGGTLREQAIAEAETEGEFDRWKDRALRQTIMQNTFKKLAIESEKETALGQVVDFAKIVLFADVLSKVWGMGTINFVQGVKDMAADLSQASPEQLPTLIEQHKQTFEQMAVGTNPDYTEDMFNMLGANMQDEHIQMAFAALDVGMFGWLIGSPIKAGVKLFSSSRFSDLMRDIDPVKRARDIVFRNTKDAETGARLENSLSNIEDVSPLKISVGDDKVVNTRSLYKEVDDEVRAIDTQLHRLRGKGDVSPVDPNLVDPADLAMDALKSQGLDVTKARIGAVELGNIGDEATIILRNSKGNEFTTAKGAEKYAESLGIGQEKAAVVQTSTGKFVVKVKSFLDDAAYPLEFDKIQAVTFLGRKLGSIDHWVDKTLLSLARASEGSVGQTTKTVEKILRQTVGRLNQKQRRDLSRVLEIGRSQEKWLNNSEFTQTYRWITGGRMPSKKELVANRALRKVSDFSWEMSNKALYDEAKRAGYKSVTLKFAEKLGPQNGNIVGKGKKKIFRTQPIYDVTAKMIKRFSADEAEGLMRGGKKLVALSGDAIERIGKLTGYPARYVLIHGDEVVETALSQKQLGYKGGGSIHYEAGGFVKQAKILEFGDSTMIRLRDKTLWGATSLRQAREFADKINRGIEIVTSRSITPSKAAEILMDELDMTVEQWTDMIKRFEIDIRQPVVAIGDREVIDLGNMKFVDDFSHEISRARSEKRVPHVNGEELAMMDPLTSVALGHDIAARQYSWATFKEMVPAAFMQKFGKYLDLSKKPSLLEALNAPIKDSAIRGNQKLAETILGHQEWVRSVLRVPTNAERAWVEMVDRRVDQLFNSDIAGLFANRAVDWMGKRTLSENQMRVTKALSQDPVAKFKGFAFDAALGLFNPATAILQASQAPIVAAIAGKRGLRSLREAPWIAGLLAMDDKAVTALVQKQAKNLKYDDLGDLELYLQEFRNTGFDHYGNNLHYLDGITGTHGYNSVYSKSGSVGTIGEKVGDAFAAAGDTASTLRRTGRLFFTYGDLMPRITAFSTAVRKWRANAGGINPKGLGIDSVAGRNWIRNEADRLVLGVSGVDIQLLFKGRGGFAGIFSMMSQFYSYPFRMLSAMTPGMNRSFTLGEKARMTSAYVGLYGSSGYGIATVLSDYIFNEQTGSLRGVDKALGLPQGAAFKILESGVIDGSLYALTDGEADTAFGRRAGPGSFLPDLFQSMDRFDMHSPTTWGAMFGAGPRSMTNLVDSIGKTAQTYSVFTEPSIAGIENTVIAGLAASIGSFSLGYRAYLAAKTGKLYDKSAAPISPINAKEVALMLVGIPPNDYRDSSLLFDNQKAFKQVVRDGAEHFRRLELDYALAVQEGDEERQKRVLEWIHHVGLALQEDPEVFEKVLETVNSEVGRGTRLESLAISALERLRMSGEESHTVYTNQMDRLEKTLFDIDNDEDDE